MATFAGYRAGGVLGGIIATISMIIPALIIVCFIATILSKFKDNKYVNYAFYGIRACVAALVFSSALGLMQIVMLNTSGEFLDLNIPAIILFCILLYGMIKYKKHPIVYIGISAIIGCFISF
jgi:chromate transporter